MSRERAICPYFGQGRIELGQQWGALLNGDGERLRFEAVADHLRLALPREVLGWPPVHRHHVKSPGLQIFHRRIGTDEGYQEWARHFTCLDEISSINQLS